ncbi:Gamma-aminobutyric acid type B receptor subunit 2 [Phytophthora cinnamomi]|uniref:Gamma-aminobutyric acid type B receptor subunit 2 n=1 Tax=Phytophthora cinnamomi TaxID=4785 RepID=UPI003559EDFA|nr:Gamma-aminobutyric acid type B receptor subunit 2 [Phytophthora cinnamomi]
MEEMQLNSEAALAKVKEQSEARAHAEMGALSAAEEQLTAGSSFQALQTLIRRLFQPTTVKDLFVSVGSTFAQILHGSAAVLFLFDPGSNELWTQREENQLIQVPASLGIAGSTLSSGATLIITDVSSDSQFHPMVDQFVLSDLRQDDATSALMMATRPSAHVTKPTVGMVSSALISPDGAVYGILQVAFPTSSLSSIDRRVLVTQTQLYSKTCCFYVEQLVFEMLRNCRDRVRARAPEKFITLFKQNKNWRKYFAAIERKAVDLESKLREVLDEREQLIQARSDLQKRHQHVKDKLESSERNTKDVSKLVVDWKRKLAKWQKVLDEKDQAIAEKTSELAKVKKEFERYRRERRSKELQAVLNSSNTAVKRPSSISSPLEESDDSIGKSPSLSDRGQLSILKADQTRLKSQLVRAEADNLLLVKAISIARNQHGELPRTIQAEVTRVATRVSRRAPPEA